MREGWSDDDYIVLFGAHAGDLEAAYGICAALPGYRLVGLRSWDDFIVEDASGARFVVPTVPVLVEHLSPFNIDDQRPLKADDRMVGRIKWYITPLVFGGDPKLGNNVIWVTLEQHAQLVTWWNAKYREMMRADRDG